MFYTRTIFDNKKINEDDKNKNVRKAVSCHMHFAKAGHIIKQTLLDSID